MEGRAVQVDRPDISASQALYTLFDELAPEKVLDPSHRFIGPKAHVLPAIKANPAYQWLHQQPSFRTALRLFLKQSYIQQTHQAWGVPIDFWKLVLWQRFTVMAKPSKRRESMREQLARAKW